MWMLTQLTSSLLGDSFSGFGYSPLTHLLISIMGAYLWTTQLLSMVKHFSLAFCQSSLLILWSFQTLTFISANQGVYWSLVGSPPMWCSLCGFTISSVQFSHSVVSDSLPPHESQHSRPPCPSPTPRVHSNSCPLSQWCHPAISSSVVPFSSCPQSLPSSGSFPMS